MRAAARSRFTSLEQDTVLHAMTPQPKKSRPTSSHSFSASPPPEAEQLLERTVTKKKRRRDVAEEFKLELTMMNHDLLSKEEEQYLAGLLIRARQLQERIDALVSTKTMAAQLAKSRDDLQNFLVPPPPPPPTLLCTMDTDDEDEDTFECRPLTGPAGASRPTTTATTEHDAVTAEYGGHPSAVEAKSGLLERLDRRSRVTTAAFFLDDDGADDGDVVSAHGSTGGAAFEAPAGGESGTLRDAFGLTDDDVVRVLRLPGGRAELQTVLLRGARARDTLIRRNLKLVSSISKRWSRLSSGGDTESLYRLYSGGWDRPSLSEAIQEGVIGLTTAAERFNPSRGLRFSTYATYWITNSVRQCFQRASTGCLRLPINYYDTKTKYKALVKEYYDADGCVPAMGILARDMGMTERRLQLTLRLTQPLLSTDGLLMPRGSTKAGKAGNVNRGDDNLLISDTLVDDSDLNPEDRVELSLLRQSLEHAMAVELAPFERDVLRLRLGLDDGVVRTCREVALECGGRLSTVEIRTTEQRALKKLRSPASLATYKLLAYLDFANVDRETVKIR